MNTFRTIFCICAVIYWASGFHSSTQRQSECSSALVYTVTVHPSWVATMQFNKTLDLVFISHVIGSISPITPETDRHVMTSHLTAWATLSSLSSTWLPEISQGSGGLDPFNSQMVGGFPDSVSSWDMAAPITQFLKGWGLKSVTEGVFAHFAPWNEKLISELWLETIQQRACQAMEGVLYANLHIKVTFSFPTRSITGCTWSCLSFPPWWMFSLFFGVLNAP